MAASMPTPQLTREPVAPLSAERRACFLEAALRALVDRDFCFVDGKAEISSIDILLAQAALRIVEGKR